VYSPEELLMMTKIITRSPNQPSRAKNATIALNFKVTPELHKTRAQFSPVKVSPLPDGALAGSEIPLK
jgi:hypothetical protein